MIITHTSNPSIDYYLEIRYPLSSGMQRVLNAYCLPGGKGLNVSMILDQLGIPSTATAFLGGFTGDFIERKMSDYQYISLESLPIEEDNRINVKIRGEESAEINVAGPAVPYDRQEAMADLLAGLLENGSWLIISGSLAKGVGVSWLKKVSEIAHGAGAKLVIDVPDLTAEDLAEMKPDLIKPNMKELRNMFFADPSERPENLVRKLQEEGIKNILLSDSGRGASFYTGEDIYRIVHPWLTAVNSVGSGDSMLAAFVGMLDQGRSLEEALIYAGAAGQATAVSEGLAGRAAIEKFKSSVKISHEYWHPAV